MPMMNQEIQPSLLRTKLQELLIYSKQINEIIEKRMQKQEKTIGEEDEQNW